MTAGDPQGGTPNKPARPGRRSGDEEVGAILERAADLQGRSVAVTDGAARGLTLADLRQIAEEAGIDPRFVDLASADLAAPVKGTGIALAGGAYRWRSNSTIPGEIDDSDRDRILQAIRSVFGTKGEVADVFGRMEWSFDEGTGPVIIGITSRDGVVEIDVAAEKAGEVGLIYGMIVPFGGLLGGAAVAKLLVLTGGLAAIPVVAIAGLSYLGVRIGWGMRSKWWERRIGRITERIGSIVQEVTALPPASGEDGVS